MERSKVITVRMNEAEIEELDKKRGSQDRSEYIRGLIIGDISSNFNEEILNMTANTTFLLRYLSVALGHKELAIEAKGAADEYVKKVKDK